MLEAPTSLVEAPEPEPPPLIEVTRSVDEAPTSFLDAMRFWLDQALQTG
jgi:hypothetical protein